MDLRKKPDKPNKDDRKGVMDNSSVGGRVTDRNMKESAQGSHTERGTTGQPSRPQGWTVGTHAMGDDRRGSSNRGQTQVSYSEPGTSRQPDYQPGLPVGSSAPGDDTRGAKKKKKSGATRRKLMLERQTRTFSEQSAPAGTSSGTAEVRTSAVKRIREPSDEQASNASKRPNLNKSFRDAVSGCRMAIITEDFPVTKITNEDVQPIVGSIWKTLIRQPDPLPAFSIGSVISGALHVFCKDQRSADWIAGLTGMQVGSLTLKMVSAKDLPKPVKMAWKTKNVWIHDLPCVLEVMERLNPGLKTSEWKVIDTVKQEASVRRIVLMDQTSADIIKSMDYCLYAGVDKSYFKLLEDSEKKVEEKDDASVGAVAPPLAQQVLQRGAGTTDGPPQVTIGDRPVPSPATSQRTDDVLGDMLELNLSSPLSELETMEEAKDTGGSQ